MTNTLQSPSRSRGLAFAHLNLRFNPFGELSGDQRALQARVVRDGLAAADGRHIIADIDGNVHCLGE